MDKKLRSVLGVLALVCTGLTGCSGGGDSSHGVSQSKALNTLTQQEIDQICEYVDSRMTDASESLSPEGFLSIMDDKDFACTSQAVAITQMMDGTKQDCESSKKECLEEYEQWEESEEEWEDSSTDDDIDCGSPDEYADCEATVGEIDACFDAMISEMKKVASQLEKAMDAVEEAIRKISCSNLDAAMPDMEDMSFDMVDIDIEDIPDLEDVPECRAVEKKCPGVITRESQVRYTGPTESSSSW